MWKDLLLFLCLLHQLEELHSFSIIICTLCYLADLAISLSEAIYWIKRCCLVILLRTCPHLSGSLCLSLTSFLPKCIYQVVAPKSAYCLLWASRLLLVRFFSCLSQRKKNFVSGLLMSFLLLGVLPWGRLSQVRPVTAGNLSTLFLALLIRQRLICMQWLVFLAVFWLVYGEFCDELPGPHHLSVSVSHVT